MVHLSADHKPIGYRTMGLDGRIDNAGSALIDDASGWKAALALEVKNSFASSLAEDARPTSSGGMR